MGTRPELARSELEIAHIVWRLKQATVREVLAQLPADRQLDFKTVQTYLRRLEAKRYLASRMEGRTRIYRAKVKPQTVMKDLVNDFVQRVFQGESLPLVQNLIQQGGMSSEEIQQLRQMLDELEETS